mmetsp:Transcript_6293/g.21092  ORF Transcript_6293/g.21092 Transcript_6293/m.21092 type:complete len:276 (+) Transcript_6293:1445-2272(+)
MASTAATVAAKSTATGAESSPLPSWAASPEGAGPTCMYTSVVRRSFAMLGVSFSESSYQMGTSSMWWSGMPLGKTAASAERTSSGSRRSVRMISSSSPVEEAPRGSDIALEMRGRAWKRDSLLDIGSFALRHARSKTVSVSRWPVYVMAPSFPKRIRRRCAILVSGLAAPRNSGSGGTSATTFSPKFSPSSHTPHSVQTPECEQSGTVVASSARWRSALSHHFSMPVSMWSHGSGMSSRASASAPRSTRPLPPSPWPRKRPSPTASSTSHSPAST